jgi:hypothetical protein
MNLLSMFFDISIDYIRNISNKKEKLNWCISIDVVTTQVDNQVVSFSIYHLSIYKPITKY